MKTIVHQSYRTVDVPAWIERCLGSVRSWAAASGYEYRFVDNRLFDYAGATYCAYVEYNKLAITNLARLELAREALMAGYERVIWVDADVIVFDPERLTLDTTAGCAFCHQVWIHVTKNGPVSGAPKVNNCVCVFTADGASQLEQLIGIIRQTVAQREIRSSLEVGTDLLTELHRRTEFTLLTNVGLLSPSVVRGLAADDPSYVSIYAQAFGHPIYAANLCASKAAMITEPQYMAAIDALVASRGEVINAFLLSSSSQTTKLDSLAGPYLAEGSLRAPLQLPETLDYEGEFGTELTLFLPYLNWLSKAGLLHGHRIGTYRGMRCFYDDLDCLEIIEKDKPRKWVPPEERLACLPVKDDNNFDGIGRSPLHLYPDLRRKFRSQSLFPKIEDPSRPLLIVHNKHNVEWKRGPVNYISLETLDTIFRMFRFHFTIVYIRHGMTEIQEGYSEDDNRPVPFEDRAVLDRDHWVLCFDDLYARHKANGGHQDLNTFKNVLYSRCYYFISSQGGGAHHIAFFSGCLLMVLHRTGPEELWAYNEGYYRFVSSPPPILAVCRDEEELVRALGLFAGTKVSQDRVHLAPEAERLFQQLSPASLTKRHNSSRSSS